MKLSETKRTMAKRGVPEGLWMRCPQCKATIFRKEAESRLNVCPECDYHFYLPARERIAQLLDEESFEEWFTDLRPCDPLEFKDRLPYAERLRAEQAKTGMSDAALGRYDRAGGLYVSILTNPTMGGVAASFALQGDLTLAEPGALIGFAGKRTIWNTVRLELPEGFQTSEFLLEHGFIDRIVHRKDLRTEVARIIDYCEH